MTRELSARLCLAINGADMNKYKEIYDYAVEKGCQAYYDEPMSRHTSFKIGGNASLFLIPQNDEVLSDIIKKCRADSVRTFILGNGSNMLVSDDGIDAVVILMCRENAEISKLSDGIIKADAGVSLMKVCRFALNESLSGLEFAFGIPGSVGGALFMNAGAYGGEIKDVIYEADCLTPDGEIVTLSGDEMELGYRTSIFNKNNYVILNASFKLYSKEKELIKADMDDFLNRRKTKQPLEYPSAGSVFKRPVGYFAGALIEECGLKGKTIGGAQVSVKHSGFIINIGNATAKDVADLVEFVKETVKKEKGVELEPEIRIIS